MTDLMTVIARESAGPIMFVLVIALWFLILWVVVRFSTWTVLWSIDRRRHQHARYANQVVAALRQQGAHPNGVKITALPGPRAVQQARHTRLRTLGGVIDPVWLLIDGHLTGPVPGWEASETVRHLAPLSAADLLGDFPDLDGL